MEINTDFSVAHIQETTQISQARRLAQALCKEAGFTDTQAGKVAIAVTEAATNLIKHAQSGDILLRSYSQPDCSAVIEVLSLDKGKGITDLQESLRDGYSTSGSPGTGLGAMMRQSSLFDVHSCPGKGTALFMQFWNKKPKNIIPASIEMGGITVPIRGETACGDGWNAHSSGSNTMLMICDGLGHGMLAAEVAKQAKIAFEEVVEHNLSDILRFTHEKLKSTRGAAGAIAQIDSALGTIRYMGVGNTTGSIVTAESSRHMVSHNGTLGLSAPKFQEFSYIWPQEALLVFATDGMFTQWSLEGYPGLTQRHPTLIAGVLYRDFSRGRDDTGIVVVKRKAA